MSVSTPLVSFTVQKVSLYTGITGGTEGVKEGNAAAHLRATLSNRRRPDCVVLLGFVPNLSYFLFDQQHFKSTICESTKIHCLSE